MNINTAEPKLIIVDWGTTNFRAYLVDEYANCLDSVSSAEGLRNVEPDFQTVLQGHVGHWLKSTNSLPVLLCGMVGSRNGWTEVPYVTCPLNTEKLARALYQVESFNGGNCWIVPGVSGNSVSDKFDVMRGEEIQVLGAILLARRNQIPQSNYLCLPGTHNKWVSMSDNDMLSFSTTMTGEVFDLLRRESLLSESLDTDSDWDKDIFSKGLECSLRPGGLLHQLFTVRSLQLSGEHQRSQGEAYLSGVIIGNEIRSMLPTGKSTVAVIASGPLLSRYLYALDYYGFDASGIESEVATIAGAMEIAEHVFAKVNEDIL
jgi:2-dehydro-3-deoxygalactonokinase